MGPCHGAVSPKERETYKVGTVGARIFRKRVWSGSLRVTSDLAPLVEDGRKAVRSSERAEVTLFAITSEKGVEFRVARQGRDAHYVHGAGLIVPPERSPSHPAWCCPRRAR